MSRLVFNESRHVYSLDGVYVPGVTTITRKAIANEAFVYRAGKMAAEWCRDNPDALSVLGPEAWVKQAAGASRRDMEAKGGQGKQLHAIAQRLVRGGEVAMVDPVTGEEYPDDVIRMGEQAARFMDRWDVTPDTALVEAPVFHETYRYAGTLDLCATLRDGDKWLIDYKTGPSGVWPENALQLTAYARATHVQIGERDLLMPPVSHCAVLWVRPDTWELIPVNWGPQMFDAFLACMAVAGWTNLKREDVIGAALPLPQGVA